MVVALGPGKFYGSSLPRPRFYTDVKLNDERVDPPVPVLDPFLSWAEEAHWSMGGLSFQRHRLQGRIEGNIKRLRAQREKFHKKRMQTATTTTDQIKGSASKSVTPSPPPAPIAAKRRRFMALIDEDDDENDMGNRESESGNEEKIGGELGGGVGVRRRSARKLGDDFDRVASESGLGKSKGSPVKSSGDGSDTVAKRTRSRRSEKEDGDVVEEVNGSNSKGKKLKRNGKAETVGANGTSTPPSGTRTSPRLARRGSS
ncbi:uncharacterized protein LOC132310049 [Cornus florida]|uniref:uncharacterized protein LOC132310049 n=1 Tax=Cornus florida TaxID=4283 RepID=UPI00289D2BC1|nr:uncharacterized protein LOC132310049 [Cornus florida]